MDCKLIKCPGNLGSFLLCVSTVAIIGGCRMSGGEYPSAWESARRDLRDVYTTLIIVTRAIPGERIPVFDSRNPPKWVYDSGWLERVIGSDRAKIFRKTLRNGAQYSIPNSAVGIKLDLLSEQAVFMRVVDPRAAHPVSAWSKSLADLTPRTSHTR